MSKIPDDIKEAARGCFCAKEIGSAKTMPLTLARIERALLAEREDGNDRVDDAYRYAMRDA